MFSQKGKSEKKLAADSVNEVASHFSFDDEEAFRFLLSFSPLFLSASHLFLKQCRGNTVTTLPLAGTTTPMAGAATAGRGCVSS